MEHWITEVMEKFGYAGVFLLIALENLFPPIPSEVILTFGGFMTTSTSLKVPGVIIAATFGSVFGAMLLYGVGAWLNADRLEAIVDKHGRWLRLKPADIRKANAFFQKYNKWAVFLCRLVPLIRSLISIPAGSSRMNFWVFLLLTTLGSLIWNTVLVSLGAALGASWEDIVAILDVYSNVAYAVIALVCVAAGVWFVRSRFLKNRR
ncbi:DedA family protein [Paenibacillus sp. TRM 82003]|nr:DedA family protein [Paenibacillus sp. TRM 82003]